MKWLTQAPNHTFLLHTFSTSFLLCYYFFMKNPRITIGIVLYRQTQYLRQCLRSLLGQSFQDFELLLLDHDPQKQASRYLQEEMPEILADERVILAQSTGNHSEGHNHLMRKMRGEFYVCASFDMVYAEDFLAKVADALGEAAGFSFAGVRILRWDFANNRQTGVIDSVGLGVTRSQRFFDVGQGEQDTGQYPTEEIFGASGALMIFRRSLLEDLSELFDEDLHYKNDVDLCYRLRWRGERCLRISEAVCWHDRQLGEKNRKNKTQAQRADSYFGQLVVLAKNFSQDFGFGVRVSAFVRRVALWFFVHIFEREILSAERKFQKNKSQILEKSAKMERKVLASDLEKYFV